MAPVVPIKRNDHFSTQSFPKEDQSRLIQILKDNFSIEVLFKISRYQLYIRSKSNNRFVDLIRPYIHPCFDSKIQSFCARGPSARAGRCRVRPGRSDAAQRLWSTEGGHQVTPALRCRPLRPPLGRCWFSTPPKARLGVGGADRPPQCPGGRRPYDPDRARHPRL